MIYIQNDSTNPFFNHALEEYVITQMEDEAFILWRNEPSILIGRNQNTLSEIHADYVQDHQIQVVRRLTGGGTVFCDLGNINFTFITHKKEGSNGFEKFAQPVINALQSLGIPAEFTGRNDIVIEGKKISGNAQYHYQNKLLHHGTILYSGDLSKLAAALKSKPLKFSDKSVKSVASRVTNINAYMQETIDVLAFKNYLKTFIMKEHGIETVHEMSEEALTAIHEIQKKRFESYDWNYGQSPEYTFSNEVKTSGGSIEITALVSDGKVEKLSIFGDFFGEQAIDGLLRKIEGATFTQEGLSEALKGVSVSDYIHGVGGEEFISAVLGVRARRPEWLKVKLQGGHNTHKVKVLLSDLSLNTVCTEANCPNRMECYNKRTATFMILGRNCTRNCTFCNVTRLSPDPVDAEEPQKIAHAVEALNLRHAVITSVTRDDLDDQGAKHFAAVVKAIRTVAPNVAIELLIPDLQGREDLLDIIIEANPDILNHNVETVPQLYDKVRPMASFERSINVLKYVKQNAPHIKTKSGVMLGLGETDEQLRTVLCALREADCDMLTLGQYLQPSSAHIPVESYIRPEKFVLWQQEAEALGFKSVASGPLVRSSYHAETYHQEFHV